MLFREQEQVDALRKGQSIGLNPRAGGGGAVDRLRLGSVST